MTDNSINNTVWTKSKKFIFLFFFVYFVWHFFFSPDLYLMIFGFNENVFKWFDKFYTPVGLWLNDHIFHFPFDKESLQPESVIDFCQHTFLILASLTVSTIWFIIDIKRKSYTDLHFGLTIVLRIALCIITFSYGIDKLIPVQMSTPNLYQLTNSMGNQNGLLWHLLGIGKDYQMFSGALEIIAALLILFNRTLVLGLLMLFGIYLNVCMMNYAFSVGVLYFALFLFVATLFLLFPYAKKLIKLFLLQQPSSLKPIGGDNPKHKLNPILIITIGILLLVSFGFNTSKALKQHQKNLTAKRTTQIYKVVEHIQNNDTLQAIENSKNRWRYWVEYEIDNRKALTIFSMDINNRLKYYYSKDTLNNLIILFPQKNEETKQHNDTLNYLIKPNGQLEINGKSDGKNYNVLLHSFSIDSFPLMRKKPHFLPTE
jgi:hypothetical protein